MAPAKRISRARKLFVQDKILDLQADVKIALYLIKKKYKELYLFHQHEIFCSDSFKQLDPSYKELLTKNNLNFYVAANFAFDNEEFYQFFDQQKSILQKIYQSLRRFHKELNSNLEEKLELEIK
jgi:hypothetical protein